MSYGRFASIGIASAAGILGGSSSLPSTPHYNRTNSSPGYYTFKPELDGMQKEKELKEQYA